ncbi:hypothetical protein OSSY52_03150 [Tepiditoga spiralis]|uniref:asparagine synthase (glutamine-hydrolyzing) n=1 Tax=Tepiditoga spiralis TaxID=2108365 RepID=A0A7G1G577_9BACT|nr:hypothetical protein [Tepiditoga spiralis]BBE30174.1 hypothetical protein OSSY52_03150 [Tepiditoga spiralis]
MLIKLEKNNFDIIDKNKLIETDKYFIYFEGYFFYNDDFYIKNEAANFLVKNIENIENLIRELNGVFLCLTLDKVNKNIIIFNDKISFPQLFYYKIESNIYISEDFWKLRNYLNIKEFDDISIVEFLKYRFVSGKYTLLKNIFEVQPGRIYKIQNNIIDEEIWYDYKIKEKINDKEFAEKEIFNSMEKIFKRYDKIFKNKKIGLNLTGGLDSRYILGMLLKNNNANNLINFTFGTKYCEDMKIANTINKKYKLKNSYYYLDDNFINDYYNEEEISKIIEKIGFKTYYFQGFGFSKISNLHNKESIDYLLTGDNGFILGLLYKDELEKLNSFEKLTNYLIKSTSTILSNEDIEKYTKIEFNDALNKKLFDRIYEQLDKNNDLASEYVKWSILNRERNYATRNYNFYSLHSIPLYPNYENEFFELMFSLNKKLFKNQMVYINSMYKYLFIDELKDLSKILVDQRGNIKLDKNNNYIFNSKFYNKKRFICNGFANKYNLKSQYNTYPFNLIKKNKKLIYGKTKNIINNENIINKNYLLENLFNQKRKFYLYDLSVLMSLEAFMNYIKEL